VLEDKGNLAFLELKSLYPNILETFIASTSDVFSSWAIKRWGPADTQNAASSVTTDSDDSLSSRDAHNTSDWWAVKASKGNGGKDVWIANRSNFAAVASELPKDGELVIQRCK
jgi:hypothetical protein